MLDTDEINKEIDIVPAIDSCASRHTKKISRFSFCNPSPVESRDPSKERNSAFPNLLNNLT